MPHCGPHQPRPLLHLRQRALGPERRPRPRYRQGALEPERLSLLLPVAGHESDQRRLRHRAADGAESEGRRLQAENGSTSAGEPRGGRRGRPSAGRLPLPAAGELEIAAGHRSGHGEEHLRSVHPPEPAGSVRVQRGRGGILRPDVLADWDFHPGAARVKSQTVIRRVEITYQA